MRQRNCAICGAPSGKYDLCDADSMFDALKFSVRYGVTSDWLPRGDGKETMSHAEMMVDGGQAAWPSFRIPAGSVTIRTAGHELDAAAWYYWLLIKFGLNRNGGNSRAA